MIKDILKIRDLSNAEILNGIREDSSFDYQQRIPVATQANMAQVVDKLTQYRPNMNEFLNGFVNRIGALYARTQMWTNPLAVFKKGMMTHGDTVEEYMADILEAHGYDPDRDYGEKVLFGQERPAVEVNYHKVNRQNFYKVTVNDKMLRRAFLDDSGLSSLIAQIMEAPMKSDQYDEFLLMSSLLAQNERNGGFFKIQIPEFSGLNADVADARMAMKLIKALAYKLPILSREYNAAGLPMAAKPEDLILIGTPDFLSSIDVDGLAPIFHIDKAETAYERTVALPEEYMGIDGAQGILTTKDFFMVFDTLIENRMQPNPVGLYDNFFLHHHGIYSLSRFVPSIMLTSDSGTITIRKEYVVASIAAPTIRNSDGTAVTDVERGQLYELSAAVTTNPAGEEVAVAYSVTGATSNHTYVTPTGVLYVSGSEKSNSIRITAITTYTDPTNARLDGKSAYVDVAVTGDLKIDWPGAGRIAKVVVNGVEVDDIDPTVLSYTLTLPEGTIVSKRTVEVLTIGSPDVNVAVAKATGGYTATLSVDNGAGAAKVYTIAVTVETP